jgi:hypothetical protein
MDDPLLMSDGRTYERVAIERALAEKERHYELPTMAGAKPNEALKREIDKWKAANPDYRPGCVTLNVLEVAGGRSWTLTVNLLTMIHQLKQTLRGMTKIDRPVWLFHKNRMLDDSRTILSYRNLDDGTILLMREAMGG